MACTDNFIGIRACPNPVAPKSGYFIDDLEGITLAHVADIASDTDAIGLINEKISFAIRQTVSDAMAKLPNLQFNPVAESLKVACFTGAQTDGQPLVTITRNERKAPFSDLQVSRVFIKLGIAYVGDLEILDSGTVVETISIEVEPDTELVIDGLNTIVSGILSIRIPSTNLGAYTAPRSAQFWGSTAGAACCIRPYESLYLTMTDGAGIAADVTVVCNESKLLCRLLHPLKDAIIYRSGIEILNEYLATDRLNFFAINSKEWAQDKKAEWAAAYNAKIAYALSSGLTKSLQALDSACFNCAGNKFGYSI